MYRATGRFHFEGEPFDPQTYVHDRHEAVLAHPELFVEDNSSPAGRAEARSRDGSVRRSTPPGGGPYWAADDVRRIARIVEEERAGAIRSLAADPRNIEQGTSPAPRTTARRASSPGQERRDAALRAVERNADVLSAEAGDRLEGIIRGDPTTLGAQYLEAIAADDYLSAFGKLVMDPTTAHLRTTAETTAMQNVNEVDSARALGTSPGSAGGFALPFTLDPTVHGSQNPVRAPARVESIVTNEWRGVSSQGVSASYDPEGDEVSDDSTTFLQPTAETAAGRCFVPFSRELGEDWTTLSQELAKMIGDAKDQLENTAFLTGGTADSPVGILTTAGTAQRVYTEGTAVAPVIADYYSLKAALPPRFQANAAFALNPVRADAAYRLVGGGSDEPPLLPERGGPFLGKTLAEWTALSTTNTSGQKIALYGDFRQYLIADRVGMTLEIIPHLFGTSGHRPTGQRGAFAWFRTAAKLLVPGAMRYLEVH